MKRLSDKLKDILGDLRCRFEELYGDRLVEMVLYGSQARGDAEPDSDIDVLVVLKGEVSPVDEIHRTLDAVEEISLDNDVTIACMFVSESEFVEDQTPLLINIRREGMGV